MPKPLPHFQVISPMKRQTCANVWGVPLRHRGQQHAHSHLLDELLTPCRSVENRPILTPLFRHCRVERKRGRIRCVKRYWEIITDNLSKAGWSGGCVAAVDSDGRAIGIADAHRGD